jgi:hypothetical protein
VQFSDLQPPLFRARKPPDDQPDKRQKKDKQHPEQFLATGCTAYMADRWVCAANCLSYDIRQLTRGPAPGHFTADCPHSGPLRIVILRNDIGTIANALYA